MTQKRILLTDRQCRLFLGDMKEFGYKDLTFERVREIADRVHAGEDLSTNVIAAIMCRQIDEATSK